jgi:fatty-acyl-CoA synthase
MPVDRSLRRPPRIALWKQVADVARAVPDRDAVVWGGGRRSFGELFRRSERFARFLVSQQLGCFAERETLAGFQSGQDHVAIYLYNGPEYIESLLACFGSRTVPLNVNYRYVDDELRFVLRKGRARAIVYDRRFAQHVAAISPDLPDVRLLVEVGGGSVPAIEGAVPYESLAGVDTPVIALPEPRPEDLCIVYTGGTTGLPKAVLWEQSDLWSSLGATRHPVTGKPFGSLEELVAMAVERRFTTMCLPPFMHLSGFGFVLLTLTAGVTMVIAKTPEKLVPEEIWSAVASEGVDLICSVGNAMALPLLEELERGSYDLTSLAAVVNGGAAMSERVRNGLLAKLPRHTRVVDGVGSSEGGKQLNAVFSRKDAPASKPRYLALPTCHLLSLDRTRVLAPHETEEGWLASEGLLPLGYLDEAEKSAETFPTIDGVRYAIPGDKAVYVDGQVELLGRDSATINSGGEKIFAEEVELAILANANVKDVVVTGRASERWGSEVVAIVSVVRPVTAQEILSTCEKRIARYKLPKEIFFVDEVARGPNGKADHRWARSIAESQGVHVGEDPV